MKNCLPEKEEKKYVNKYIIKYLNLNIMRLLPTSKETLFIDWYGENLRQLREHHWCGRTYIEKNSYGLFYTQNNFQGNLRHHLKTNTQL